MTTKGPWIFRQRDGELYVVGAMMEHGHPTVCQLPVQPNGEPCDDAVDDGKLIASAPDLARKVEELELQIEELKKQADAKNDLRAELSKADRLNGELLKWAQEQVRSHQRIFHEACDQKDERSGDIHNCLASAYISLVKEIEKQTEKRNDVVPATEAVGGAGRCTCGSKSFIKNFHDFGCPVRE